jgi:mannose-6-phosphate isomerase
MEWLNPRAVERPWGGERLAHLATGRGAQPIGEAWIHEAKSSPALILKWIDAAEVLSVQNHPRKPGFSKREAWYFVAPPEDGLVITGMSCPIDTPDPTPFLERTPVKRGEILEMPSGRVHALTAGSFVLEVQEPLDVTYRIYDWGRGRELHLADAAASVTEEPAVTHQVPESPGSHAIIRRAEFSIETWTGPCEARADHDGILSFVAGLRFMKSCRMLSGETILLAEGERAIWAYV